MTDIARRLRAAGPWGGAALALLCGGVLALAQPPLSWAWTLFLGLPPLLWLLEGAARARGAFLRGWAAGVGFFALGLFWIVEPFQVDPETFGWMAPFALVGMAGGLALFWGTAFALARATRLIGAPLAVALACLLGLAEVARSYVLTGFPWALSAYAWIETPVAQTLALVGPFGLSALTLVAGLLPGARLGRFGRAGSVGLAAALVAAGWGWGAWRLAQPLPPRDEPVLVRIVQPNAEQRLKWRPEMQTLFFERQLAATRADPRPDIVIWPETAVPFVLDYAPTAQMEIALAARGAPVILGIERIETGEDGDRWFNSLAVLGPDSLPLAIYDKHHLVPFGEYVPLGGLLARLGPQVATLTTRGFSAGPGPTRISVPGIPPFLPLICYEAVFPQAMRPPEGRPDWLAQVTNDAWFGELSGPYQHLAQARARAIEQGLPLARSANTGISAMIDPFGRIEAQLPLGEAGHIDVALPVTLDATVYSRFGNLPPILTMLFVLGLTVYNFRSSLRLRTPR